MLIINGFAIICDNVKTPLSFLSNTVCTLMSIISLSCSKNDVVIFLLSNIACNDRFAGLPIFLCNVVTGDDNNA